MRRSPHRRRSAPCARAERRPRDRARRAPRRPVRGRRAASPGRRTSGRVVPRSTRHGSGRMYGARYRAGDGKESRLMIELSRGLARGEPWSEPSSTPRGRIGVGAACGPRHHRFIDQPCWRRGDGVANSSGRACTQVDVSSARGARGGLPTRFEHRAQPRRAANPRIAPSESNIQWIHGLAGHRPGRCRARARAALVERSPASACTHGPVACAYHSERLDFPTLTNVTGQGHALLFPDGDLEWPHLVTQRAPRR
jgi:hypothetical protein